VAERQKTFPSLPFHSSGILLVDKPEGPSSAQVVQKVKNILGVKKAGHLGTLDPFASGLLPLGINDGTKIADIFLTAQKSYSGVIALGVETDTQDSTGKVIEKREVPCLDENEIERLQEAFTGTLAQTPPMYSALKRGGVRLSSLPACPRGAKRAPFTAGDQDRAASALATGPGGDGDRSYLFQGNLHPDAGGGYGEIPRLRGPP